MIHYTGQYYANKSVYDAYRKSKDKAAFLSEHRTEIALYEAAKKQLDSMKTDGKLPTMKMLKAEKELLTSQKNQIYEDYSMFKARIRELETVLKNIDTMLHEQSKEPEQNKSKTEQNVLNLCMIKALTLNGGFFHFHNPSLLYYFFNKNIFSP